MARVDNMLKSLRAEPSALLFTIFSKNLTQALYRTARERVVALPGGPFRKLRLLKRWIAEGGDSPTTFPDEIFAFFNPAVSYFSNSDAW